MDDMTITKREVLVSIVIVCVMILFGVLISGGISDRVMERQQEYNVAVQIDGDKDLFEYGMRTNVGNAFVYGELKAVGSVTFDEIGGEYSYVKKVREEYTRHTRTVTKTRTVNGKTQTYTETEVYYSWDYDDSWSKHIEKITFLGVEFDYGMIDFPGGGHIDTIYESSKVRYVYSGNPTYSIGTVYTNLSDGTMSPTEMYHGRTIPETLEIKSSDWSVGVFWFFWITLTGGLVVGFYYFENNWLEDKRTRSYGRYRY